MKKPFISEKFKREAMELLRLNAADLQKLIDDSLNKKHSDLSASGAERWLNCPWSAKDSQDLPSQINIWSLEGTLAHNYLEEWLRKVVKNQFGAIAPKGLFKNKDMLTAVKSAVESVKYNYIPKQDELLIEEKISLEFIHPEMFGTGDIGIVEEFGRLEIWDYKHGKGYAVDVVTKTPQGYAVDVVTKTPHGYDLNTQLMFYLIGLAHKYRYNFKSFSIGIIQPRAEHRSGPIRSVNITRREIKNYTDLFKRGVDRVYSKNPAINVGPWCKWCRKKDICPKQEQIKYEKHHDMFDEVC